MPDNTHINVGIRRIKLGWVPEGVLRKAKVVWGNPRELGGKGTAGKKNEGEPSAIPPWLPEHLCKHCGVQSKAGAAGLAHTCEREEKGLSVICPAQESTIAQDTQGKKILNEVSAHKNLRELLAESTTILSMCSPYGPEGQSLNSQGPKNHNTIPRLKGQGPFVSSGTEDFTQQCGQISIMPGH